ncbi:MAG: hypothetical protein CL596_02420 [Alteromonas sp.]|nr:hypothetical protein [Alteromonas sp.]MAY21652.1 hypothetical protein [Flavobacteriaceae bacterium]|tara:strand:+ start:20336 stop:21496 length:1161 start_codon:yes stop_codon:yes gene_type:complete
MELALSSLYKDAITLLHQLVTPHGFLASTIEADNYKRIWARDSVVCGLAGLWIDDTVLIKGLRDSLLTLAKYQNELGAIPSNVMPNSKDVSYGSLAGRIDTNTWFILGSCLYYQKTQDEETWKLLKPSIQKSRAFLKATEFNNRGWIYTPLSGNWADEYPVHGYTLYDNVLRLWGEQLWGEITGETFSGFENIKQKTKTNFWPSEENDRALIYQQPAFEKALQEKQNHFTAFILPGVYDNRFDAAGNALAILFFGLSESQKTSISTFVETLPKHLVPAFWPMITPESTDWNLLEGNYSFAFKNQPGDFHNGGVWPVWMGLFCYALSQNGLQDKAFKIINAFTDTTVKNPAWDFQEYINPKTLQLGGKTKMGYSASGIVFMKLAMEA